MAYRIVVPPQSEPVSLEQALAHCKAEDDPETNLLLQGMIAAARELAEHETGRALCTQTRELVLDAFPEAFKLAGAPIQSLVSLKYYDQGGVERTVDPQDLVLDLDNEPGYLVPAPGHAWPASFARPNAVRARYVCGYGGPNDVPKAIVTWMLLAIGSQYAQRETFTTGQSASLADRFWQRFLDPYRIYEAV